MFYPFFNYLFATPLFTITDNRPPSIYDILNAMLNFGKSDDEKVKISDLAKEGHTKIFDFSYPLSNYVNKDNFEIMILNKFLQRRIGFETFTAFKIQLNVKLNEIMPKYNKLFDALENWDIFLDGELTTREGFENNTANSENEINNTSENTTENIADLRSSNTPQNQLQNVRDGSYVTNYDYNTNTANSSDVSNTKGTTNSTNENKYSETIKRSPADKIQIFKEMQENINSIYTLIFNDLEELFYQLI